MVSGQAVDGMRRAAHAAVDAAVRVALPESEGALRALSSAVRDDQLVLPAALGEVECIVG